MDLQIYYKHSNMKYSMSHEPGGMVESIEWLAGGPRLLEAV